MTAISGIDVGGLVGIDLERLAGLGIDVGVLAGINIQGLIG